jgi:hypothetical protein
VRRAAAVAALVVLGACTGGGGSDEAGRAFEQTCSLVRSGVAAFNENRFDLTVDRFRSALEPARAYADASDASSADDLLEAVEYYADLPAADYRRAFETSPDFKRHQATTLGQCGDAQPEDAPDQESQT